MTSQEMGEINNIASLISQNYGKLSKGARQSFTRTASKRKRWIYNELYQYLEAQKFKQQGQAGQAPAPAGPMGTAVSTIQLPPDHPMRQAAQAQAQGGKPQENPVMTPGGNNYGGEGADIACVCRQCRVRPAAANA